MRLKEMIKETASGGSTGASSVAYAPAGSTPKAGQFFGGDPNASIYGIIKKNRENRKKKVVENMHSKTYVVKWQVEDAVGRGGFVHSSPFQCDSRQTMDLDVEAVLDKWLMEHFELDELYDTTINYRVYFEGKRVFEGRYNYTDRHDSELENEN